MSEPEQRFPYTLYHRRHIPNPADTDDANRSSQRATTPPRRQGPPSQDLSETQLRQLYEEEEVEKFMSLFSAYVTEVRLPQATDPERLVSVGTDESLCSGRTADTIPSVPLASPSLSQFIAYNYLSPYLPSATPIPSTFTLKRLRSASQRLYLAIFPPYQAFLLDLTHLALWKDNQRSLKYCSAFWILWFFDLLLPALVFRILFGLLQRRLLPYPTLQELQERRQETARALKFGEVIQQRLSVTSLGPIELWKLFKLYKLGTEEGRDVGNEINGKHPDRISADTTDPSTVIAGTPDEEEDLKRDLLHLLEIVADFHERIKNIYTWRRPNVSRRYAIFLSLACLCTLVLPTKYVAKFIYWFGGMLFWHVPPIIIALPHEDRARVPLLFSDAPTDADYAIDLIAKRVATGQDDGTVLRRANQSRHTFGASTDSLAFLSDDRSSDVRRTEPDGINWRKWSERVVHGKSLVEEGRQILSNRVSGNQTSSETPAPHSAAEHVHVFMAQYASFPGLIALTSTTFSFTPITASRARLVISRDQIRGVKRSGLMKGITVTWLPVGSVDEKGRDEKFHWVGDRDELFARLLGPGPDGGRWVRV